MVITDNQNIDTINKQSPGGIFNIGEQVIVNGEVPSEIQQIDFSEVDKQTKGGIFSNRFVVNINEDGTVARINHILASEILSAYTAVTIEGYTVDASDFRSLEKYAGIVLKSYVVGEVISIINQGILSFEGWNFNINEPVFVNTLGRITSTQIEGGNSSKIIGYAITTNSFFLADEPVILNI